MLYKCISYTHPSDKLAHMNIRRRLNLLVVIQLDEELTLMVTYLRLSFLWNIPADWRFNPALTFLQTTQNDLPLTIYIMHMYPKRMQHVCTILYLSFLHKGTVTNGAYELLKDYILLYDCIILFMLPLSIPEKLLSSAYCPKVHWREWDKEQSWICRK